MVVTILTLLPQYIIAFAAVFGAWAAWSAWKPQQLSKRKFEVALDLKIGLRRLQDEMAAATNPLVPIDGPIEQWSESLSDRFNTKVKNVLEAYNNTAESRMLAETFLCKEVQDAIDEVKSVLIEYRNTVDDFLIFQGQPELLVDDEKFNQARRLELIHAHPNQDNFFSQLSSSIEKVEELLLPTLNLHKVTGT